MILVIDYGVGNVGSILNMLRKCGADVRVSSMAREVEDADKLVLPGVGAFDHGMQQLRRFGLIAARNVAVRDRRTPILGICLGMQLFGKGSEEGREPGLGWIDGRSVRFAFGGEAPPLKVPHMGWNVLAPTHPASILAGLEPTARFYFVHSYHLCCDRAEDVVSTTTYGYPFASMIVRANVIGVQFHPEKSHRYGLWLLQRFAEL